MKVADASQIINNLKIGTLDQLQGQKAWWLNGMPYAVGATALKILSEVVTRYPADQVISYAAPALNYGIYPVIVVGAWKFWKALEKEQATIQGRNIQYVQLPKSEFDRLQSELNELKNWKQEQMLKNESVK